MAALLGFAAVNGLAWSHAGAMMIFAPAGERTPPPESLGALETLEVLLTGVKVPRPTLSRSPAELGLEATTHAIPGEPPLEGWHIPAPESKGLVILGHGYAGARDQLLETAAALHGLGWDSLLLDFRGSGGSGGDRTTLGYLEAEDLAAAVAWAGDELGQPLPVLYGFSMGAAAALRASGALRVPARALVLEACFDRMLTTARHRFRAMGLPGSPGAELLVFWGGVRGGTDALRHDPARYATGVRIPSLVIQGDRDPRVQVSEARSIARALAPRGTLVVAGGVGHEPLVTADPALWAQAVGGFLERAAIR